MDDSCYKEVCVVNKQSRCGQQKHLQVSLWTFLQDKVKSVKCTHSVNHLHVMLQVECPPHPFPLWTQTHNHILYKEGGNTKQNIPQHKTFKKQQHKNKCTFIRIPKQ